MAIRGLGVGDGVSVSVGSGEGGGLSGVADAAATALSAHGGEIFSGIRRRERGIRDYAAAGKCRYKHDKDGKT